jgi:hypothetical protein
MPGAEDDSDEIEEDLERDGEDTELDDMEQQYIS